MKILKIPIFLPFFFPLDFAKFQSPPDFVEFKNPVPPSQGWVGGGGGGEGRGWGESRSMYLKIFFERLMFNKMFSFFSS